MATTSLPSEWCGQLSQICSNFCETSPAEIIYFANYCSSSTPLTFLMPPVIIWSPLEQLPRLRGKLVCPKCTTGFSLLHASGWRDGSKGRRSEPRKIYGENGVTLLAGRVYTCTKGHEVVGYHPGILRNIPTCFIPFSLWHITGFTKPVAHLITSLLTSGLSLHEIARILLKRQVSWYCNQRLKFLQFHQDAAEAFPSLKEWQCFFSSSHPSPHAISGCFLDDFWGKEMLYTKHMQSTSISDGSAWLSCDHTFASATNIGTARTGDKKWVTQYGALFCVLNSFGQVVTWKLTSGVSFGVVEDALISLKERLKSQGKTVSEFFIDNCCAWRRKLQQVFGTEMKVSLDIFHAVKRLSDKIPKRHHLRRECMSDWSLVFRDPTDHGEKRCKVTPDPTVLESNLDQFEKQWKDAKYDGVPVLNEAALKELSGIRKHMKKGCLSGIGPGCGTNRNESLHKDLNNIMSSSRYGVELAYALFTMCFYNHNERMSSSKECAYPVEFYYDQNDDHSVSCLPEKFGLSFESKISDGSAAVGDLDINCTTYSEMYTRITALPQYHLKKDPIILNDDSDGYLREEMANEGEADVSGHKEEDPECASILKLKAIIIKAVKWHYVHKAVSGLSSTATVSVYSFPFIASMTSHLFDHLTEDRSEGHEKRLKNVLGSWNLVMCESANTGIFNSIASNLKCQAEHNVALSCIMANVGIMADHSTCQIRNRLKELVAEEWLGEYSEDYQAFMTHAQLEQQAVLLQQSDSFMPIGDLSLMAVSNQLGIPLVLFSSLKNLPIAVQLPTRAMLHPEPVLLAYTQGNFFAVQPGTTDEMTEHNFEEADAVPTAAAQVTTSSGCNCGRKATKSTPCSYSLKDYSCRCPCYSTQTACGTTCHCKGCSNPFGVKAKTKQEIKTGQKRKRESHHHSVTLRGKATVTFMEEIGEPLSIGGFSKTEFLVMCAILATEQSTHFSWNEVKNVDADAVHTTYTSILDLLQGMGISLSLYPRTGQEILKLLKLSVFKSEISFQQTV